MEKIPFGYIADAHDAEELVKFAMLYELRKKRLDYNYLSYIGNVETKIVNDWIQLTLNFVDGTENLILGPLPMERVIERCPSVEEFAEDIVDTLIAGGNEALKGMH